jgi:high-affinity Fe2+/Pb2+ permease
MNGIYILLLLVGFYITSAYEVVMSGLTFIWPGCWGRRDSCKSSMKEWFIYIISFVLPIFTFILTIFPLTSKILMIIPKFTFDISIKEVIVLIVIGVITSKLINYFKEKDEEAQSRGEPPGQFINKIYNCNLNLGLVTLNDCSVYTNVLTMIIGLFIFNLIMSRKNPAGYYPQYSQYPQYYPRR